ncbi:hypothetical protein BN2497_1209 [Janthinobacterium sp. CG23_2]|nr:hypothetical protein BN2497_1209 [Janthinobacterium sp. CG23_2]CUU27002.1 hypothetical protein BN3177_1209 [Janthinobacterium sp. CG23_2]
MVVLLLGQYALGHKRFNAFTKYFVKIATCRIVPWTGTLYFFLGSMNLFAAGKYSPHNWRKSQDA